MISELVKELRWIADYEYQSRNSEGTIRRAADVIEMLSEKVREPKQEWIPCSERLPEDNKEVLMSLRWGIDIGEYRNGEWHSEWINHYDDDNVLAWMPLPPAYKGADDD